MQIGGGDLKRFATEYGVGRFPQYKRGEDGKAELDIKGKKTSRGAEIADDISAEIDRIYRPAFQKYESNEVEPPDGKRLAELWWNAIEAVRPHTYQNSKSFCKKAMWFYLPSKVTMWDAFAARSLLSLANDLNISPADHKVLRRFPAEQHEAEVFLEAFVRTFETLHKKVKADAQAASEAIAHALKTKPYPYTRRIVDKALWFLGAESDEQRALAIRHALRRYPKCAGLLSAARLRYPDGGGAVSVG